MNITCYNGVCYNASVSEAGTGKYGVLVATTSEIYIMVTGDELYMDHILGGIMCKLHLKFDRGIIYTSGSNNSQIVSEYLNETYLAGKLS